MTASFSEDTARELCDGEMKTEPSDLQLLERMRRGELAGAPWTIMCAGLLALAALGCGGTTPHSPGRGGEGRFEDPCYGVISEKE